jgi:hypothetical protein
MLAQDRWADERLEPPEAAMRRALLRVEARRIWTGNLGAEGLASALELSHEAVVGMMRTPWFGAAWDAIETAAPRLRRQPIAMTDLAEVGRRAETLLARLKSGRANARRSGLERGAERAEVTTWTR